MGGYLGLGQRYPPLMLQFRLAGVPVEVETSFLLVGLLGWGVFTGVNIIAWILAAFTAVLLHEMGHALTARRFGASVAIRLHAFGGVTSWGSATPLSSGRRFLVAAAGSFIGMVVAGVSLLIVAGGTFGSLNELDAMLSEPGGTYRMFPTVVRAFLYGFWWAAIGWGILNWLPIRGLDGRHMLDAVLERVAPRRGAAIGRAIGIFTGVGAAIVGAVYGQWLAVIIAVMLTLPELRSDTPRPIETVKPRQSAQSPSEEEFPI